MANEAQSRSSEKEPADRFHFTVGLFVLATGVCFSAFAIQILLLR